MSKPELVKDPSLGEFYRTSCDTCGKIFESVSEKAVVNNLLIHRGVHNGHRETPTQ